MSTIIFEPLLAPQFHASIIGGPPSDVVIAAESASNNVFAVERPAGVIARSAAHASILGSPPRDLVSSGDVGGNRVFGIVAADQVYSTSIAIEPTVNYVWGVPSLPGVVSSGHMTFHGSVLGGPAKDWVRADNYIVNGVMAVAAPDRVYSSELIDYVGGVFILLTPGFLYAEGSTFDLPMGLDIGAVSDSASSTLTIQARDRAVVVARPTSSLSGTSAIADSALAREAADLVIWLIAEAEVVAEDSASAYLDMLLSAVDTALVTGAATSQFSAMLAVALLAEVHDAAVPLLDASVEETMAALDEAAIARVALVLEAMSAALATDEATNAISMTALALSDAGASDDVGSSLEALAAAFDAGSVLGIARFGADIFAMYAMTLDGALVSEYDVQVNSQATIGGRVYAATPNGLFLMEGDDDAGAPIVARLRKGWTSLGTLFKKQVANAYLGYTSDGQIRLKVSTTDNTNAEAHSVVYAVNKVAKRTVAENRIDMAKGRHSVYWDFEIGNVLGSDFELDVIKVWRLALNRRK